MHRQRFIHIFFISILTITFFHYCYLKCQDGIEGPHMVLEEDSYDFGEAEQGEVLTHVFNFENCGSDTLRIKRVRGT